MNRTHLLLTLALLALPAMPAQGISHLIQPDGGGDQPTIQTGIEVAADGDTLLLVDGTYLGDGNRDLDYLGKLIVIRSISDNPADCVIDCEGSEEEPHRGCDFWNEEDSRALLRGVTIRNGYADGECCEDLTGGAIRFRFEVTPRIENCIFENNVAVTDGGALLCSDHASPWIDGCTFIDNSAPVGGTIACGGFASPRVSASTFVGNSALTDPGNGGVLYARLYSDPVFTDCTLYGNAALNGSAVYCAFSSSSEFRNTLVTFGSSGASVARADSSCTLSFACCDIYGNAGGDWVEMISDQLGSAGNISADPLFCDAPGGDLRLHADSPCLPGQNPDCGLIGAWPVGCPTTDAPEGGETSSLWLGVQPNPCTRQATLCFLLPAADARLPVRLRILDLSGRCVRTLVSEALPPGPQQVVWDGCDHQGRPAPSGIYFSRLTSDSRALTRRLHLLR